MGDALVELDAPSLDADVLLARLGLELVTVAACSAKDLLGLLAGSGDDLVVFRTGLLAASLANLLGFLLCEAEELRCARAEAAVARVAVFCEFRLQLGRLLLEISDASAQLGNSRLKRADIDIDLAPRVATYDHVEGATREEVLEPRVRR